MGSEQIVSNFGFLATIAISPYAFLLFGMRSVTLVTTKYFLVTGSHGCFTRSSVGQITICGYGVDEQGEDASAS